MDLDTNIQNTASEGTTPNEPETQQDDVLDSASGTAPQDPTAANDDSARSDGEGADPAAEQNADNQPYFTIRYNHETHNLNLEEARMAAQKGIRFSALSEKLDRAAAIKGTSAEELIDKIIADERESYKNGLIERLGGDGETVERLMKLYDIEQADKYKKTLEERAATEKMNEHTLNERLAAEFLELKGEFPEFLEYGNLPAEVRKAAESGKDLMSALLLHRHKEEKSAAKAREQAAAAAKATAGSLSVESENVNTDEKNFLKGLWG